VRLLTRLEKRHGWEIGDLEGVPDYAEFVKSKEYRAWMQARAETN
jgi:hypothetical protein